MDALADQAHEKGPGDEPGPAIQNPRKERIMSSVNHPTESRYEAAAHAIRVWIEQQVNKPKARAALAAAEKLHDLTISDEPFERLACLDILIRRGLAPDVTPDTLPNFLAPPSWATETEHQLAYGSGSIEITFWGTPHGEEVPVRIVQTHEIVLWPTLYDDGAKIGDHYSDGPSLSWDATAAERLIEKSPAVARGFAIALAAAANELDAALQS